MEGWDIFDPSSGNKVPLRIACWAD